MNKVRLFWLGVTGVVALSLVVALYFYPVFRSDNVNDNLKWIKIHGAPGFIDPSVSATEASNGGYAMAGYKTGSTGVKGSLIKTDSLGNLEWEKTYAIDPGFAFIFGVNRTRDGGYVLAGQAGTAYPERVDSYLVKTDSLGNVEWEKTYASPGFDVAYKVYQTLDEGYILCGETKGREYIQPFLLKTDSLGNVEWEKTYGGPQAGGANSVFQTSDGGYAFAGWTYSKGRGNCEGYLVKVDSLGDVEWEKTYGDMDTDILYFGAQTSDQGYILVGSNKVRGGGCRDLWVLKTNSLGSLLWEQIFGGPLDDLGTYVTSANDGGYLITGWTTSDGISSFDAWVIKTNAWGMIEWEETIGGPGIDGAWWVKEAADGGFIVVGETQLQSNKKYISEDRDTFIAKLTPLG